MSIFYAAALTDLRSVNGRYFSLKLQVAKSSKASSDTEAARSL
jgi:hypothetical protein